MYFTDVWVNFLIEKKIIKKKCRPSQALKQKKKLNSFGRELGKVLNQVTSLYHKLREDGIELDYCKYDDDEDEDERKSIAEKERASHKKRVQVGQNDDEENEIDGVEPLEVDSDLE